MKKPLKILRNFFITVVVIALVAVVAVQYALGPVIMAASEEFGPKILNTPVKVETAKFNVLTGTCRFSGVVIGPPEGYAQIVFELGDLRITIDVLSVFKDTVVVKEIIIESPKAAYELRGLTSNISAITDHLEKKSTGFQAKEQEREQNGGKKVTVEKFVFRNGSVKVASATLGGGVSVPLPSVELTGIGKKSKGVTGLELTREIFVSVGAGIVDAAAGIVIGAGELVVEGVSAVGGAVVEGASAVGGAVVGGVSAVGSAISGLFSSSPEEEGKEK